MPASVSLRVIEPGDIARGIAEGRMGGDVLDPLAVGIDLAAVAQAFKGIPGR
jgi:hypothetical protein